MKDPVAALLDPTDRLMAVVSLTTQDEALKFMRAAEEIELSLEGTSARIVNTSDYVEGEGPVANENPEGGAWTMIGVIAGPDAKDVPANRRDAVLANWSGEIISILESYGLIEERETFH